jgi:transcriptional regulator with XRE-family HTH domain
MGSIDDALAAIDALKPEEKLVYQRIAGKFGVERSTLARRHQGKSVPRAIK